MRLHVIVRSKRTTISIEDTIIGFMAAKLCRSGDLFLIATNGKKSVIKWIQKTVNNEVDSVPEKHISQWVRDRIIHEIVTPDILEKSLNAKRFLFMLKTRSKAEIDQGKLPAL